jgi:hypothetical protein
MSSSASKARLREIFGSDTTSAVDTFGPGLRPYLPKALATPWHDDKPPAFAVESKFAWSGRTDISVAHYTRPPAIPTEVASSALLHFHQMVSTLAAAPGTVPERSQRWVSTGCPAVLCYMKCWDPSAQIYSAPLLTVLSLPGFPLEDPDPPTSLWHLDPTTTPAAPFDVDDGTTIIATVQASIPVAARPTVTTKPALQYPKVWSGPELLADASTLYCLEGSRFFSILAALGISCPNPTSLAGLTVPADNVPNGILPLPLDSSGNPSGALLLTRALPLPPNHGLPNGVFAKGAVSATRFLQILEASNIPAPPWTASAYLQCWLNSSATHVDRFAIRFVSGATLRPHLPAAAARTTGQWADAQLAFLAQRSLALVQNLPPTALKQWLVYLRVAADGTFPANTILPRPFFLQWATLVFRAPNKPAYWRRSSLGSFFDATRGAGGQDLRKPSIAIPPRLRPYLGSARPHAVDIPQHLPIQTAAEIEAARFQEDEAEDDDLLATPEYLRTGKRPPIIDLSADPAKRNLWPGRPNLAAPAMPASLPPYAAGAPAAPPIAAAPDPYTPAPTAQQPPGAFPPPSLPGSGFGLSQPPGSSPWTAPTPATTAATPGSLMSLSTLTSPAANTALWKWDTVNPTAVGQGGFYMLATLLSYQSPSVGGYLADAQGAATSRIIGASDILFPASIDAEFLTRFITDSERAANHLSSLARSDQSEPDCPIRPLFQSHFFNQPKWMAVLRTNSNVEGPIQPHHLSQPTFATIWLYTVLPGQQETLSQLPRTGISCKLAYQLLSNLRWFLYTATNRAEIPNPSSTLIGSRLLDWTQVLAHNPVLQQAWDATEQSARQYTWVTLSMLQNLLSLFSTWANRMPAARLRLEMYSQNLHQRYSGASPFIFNRHNPNSRSSLLDQLSSWSTEWATVFRPGAFYQATQLLAPPPAGFFGDSAPGHLPPPSAYAPSPAPSGQPPRFPAPSTPHTSRPQLPPAVTAGKYAFELATDVPPDLRRLSVTALLRKLGRPGRLLLSQTSPHARDVEICFAFCTQKARWSGCRGSFHQDRPLPRPCVRFHLDLERPPVWLHDKKVWTEIATWLKLPATRQVLQPSSEFLALPGVKAMFS